MSRNSYTSSFTLIELLIVIGILAILTAAVVIVLNPTELLKQGRDSTRMTDLASLNKTIQLLLTQNPSVSLGTASTVYISIPDTSTICANLGLPALPSGYTYRCVPTASSTLSNGLGWLPIDFTASGIQNLSKLPIDPTNTSSTGLYYTYSTNLALGKYEFIVSLESNKYQIKQRNDGGIISGALEIGTDINSTYIGGSSCNEIKLRLSGSTSGTYWIKPPQSPSFSVYCDMLTDGGGWTLMYRRLEGVSRNLSYNYVYDTSPTWGTDYSIDRSKYTNIFTDILVANYPDGITTVPSNATKITNFGEKYYRTSDNTILGVSSKLVNIIGTQLTCLSDWNWGGYQSNPSGYASPSTNTGSRSYGGSQGGDGWGFTESSYGIYAVGNTAWHGKTKIAIFVR